MNRVVTALLLVFALVASGACAQGGGGGGGGGTTTAEKPAAAKPAPEKTADKPPPPGSPLSKITVGMNDTEVRKILGEPDNANAYMTGKAFIPFYYGGDTARTDWMYKGKGRVVFSRNQWSGALKVIRVIYNPSEAGS